MHLRPSPVDSFDQGGRFLVGDDLCRMPPGATIHEVEDHVLLDGRQVALNLLVSASDIWTSEAFARPGVAPSRQCAHVRAMLGISRSAASDTPKRCRQHCIVCSEACHQWTCSSLRDRRGRATLLMSCTVQSVWMSNPAPSFPSFYRGLAIPSRT